MVEKRALARARALRRTQTATERLLWTLLRDRRLRGLKFRRQSPIGRYVVDFLCLSNRLVIEADGPHHDPEQDAVRDAWLTVEGFRVLRFPNAEIQDRREETLNVILEAAGR
jgi:very-short-patch-repair endonuclease